MANNLSAEKQAMAVRALAEGNSIRSIERMTGIHRDTVMPLGIRVGEECAKIMDAKMRNLDCRLIQMDEIWGFIGKKQKHTTPDDRSDGKGDVWTFVANTAFGAGAMELTDVSNDLPTTYSKIGVLDEQANPTFTKSIESDIQNFSSRL